MSVPQRVIRVWFFCESETRPTPSMFGLCCSTNLTSVCIRWTDVQNSKPLHDFVFTPSFTNPKPNLLPEISLGALPRSAYDGGYALVTRGSVHSHGKAWPLEGEAMGRGDAVISWEGQQPLCLLPRPLSSLRGSGAQGWAAASTNGGGRKMSFFFITAFCSC